MVTKTVQHTPGPWRIEAPEHELVRFSVHVIGERPTVQIWADGQYAAGGFYHPIALVADNDTANAFLIAAAPKLLQRLTEAANHLASLAVEGRCLSGADIAAMEARVRDARTAIATATGES